MYAVKIRDKPHLEQHILVF